MSDLGPGEVLQDFSGRLAEAEINLKGLQVVEAEAAEVSAGAQRFFVEASSATARADIELESTRTAAIAAIETTGDGDDREVASVVMRVKGKNEDEIEDYFSQIDRIQEAERPIVIVGRPEVAAVDGLAKVIYGRTAGPKGNLIHMYRDKPGDRKLVIPITGRRGFAPSMTRAFQPFSADVFAKSAQDKPEDVVLDNEQPFEEIHFAGSAEEVSETIEAVLSDEDRSKLDDKMLHDLGVPSMVAYGEDAVKELSSRLESRGVLQKTLVARCLDGLGLTDLASGDFSEMELTDTIKDDFKRNLSTAIRYLINETGEGDKAESFMLERFAFLVPFQGKVDITSDHILSAIKEHVSSGATVEKNEEGYYRATRKGRRASVEVERIARELSSMGLLLPEDTRIKRVGLEVEHQAMRRELKNHWPIVNWYSRRALKKDIKTVASAMAKATA